MNWSNNELKEQWVKNIDLHSEWTEHSDDFY